MNYRPLKDDEDVLPGDWWPSNHTGVCVAVGWFKHPDKGWAFRINEAQAKLINDWIFCGYTDTANLYRDVWEDF